MPQAAEECLRVALDCPIRPLGVASSAKGSQEPISKPFLRR